MTELVQRIVGLFIVGFLPLSMFIPILESIKNEKITAVIGLCFLIWLAYVNAWSKRATSIYNSEKISWVSAWSKARVFLNTDIITKLAFLPGIGFMFDNWINKNNPSHGDDREIKTTNEEN